MHQIKIIWIFIKNILTILNFKSTIIHIYGKYYSVVTQIYFSLEKQQRPIVTNAEYK